jgi:anaerobic selenocysteine-containing dehydrogenase
MIENTASGQPEKIIPTTCSYDCGGRCLLRVHVSDGKIVKIGTDKMRGPGLKACMRGLAESRSDLEIPGTLNLRQGTKITQGLVDGLLANLHPLFKNGSVGRV